VLSESTNAASTPSFRGRRGPNRREPRRRNQPVHVAIAWTACGSAAQLGPTVEVELEAELHQSGQPGWTCREGAGVGWEEAICAAQCDEVILTAQLGRRPDEKHVVLALAELLTQKLAATQPLIRVRFLP
jgi:hypothetical protein